MGELQSALAGKPEIRAMASNPVMLTALAVVHWNERRLPEQRADLYESILMWLARAREDKPGRVSADRCLKLLAVLALTMQLRDPERVVQMSRRDAAEHLVRYFEPEAEKTALDLASEFVEAEEADSGILISRGTDVRFWHLTFQEFLAARAIAGMGDTDQHKLLLEQNRVYRPEWRETALLLAGVLCGKQGHGKVDGLFRAALDEADRDGSLQALARAAGLLGAMVADLKPYTYAPADGRSRRRWTGRTACLRWRRAGSRFKSVWKRHRRSGRRGTGGWGWTRKRTGSRSRRVSSGWGRSRQLSRCTRCG